eukprot:1138490-Pelagomonas_calceolata.AAC.3
MPEPLSVVASMVLAVCRVKWGHRAESAVGPQSLGHVTVYSLSIEWGVRHALMMTTQCMHTVTADVLVSKGLLKDQKFEANASWLKQAPQGPAMSAPLQIVNRA